MALRKRTALLAFWFCYCRQIVTASQSTTAGSSPQPDQEVTHACMLKSVQATVHAANKQAMTNANIWLRTSPNTTLNGCSVTETQEGVSLSCLEPICVVDYKLEFAGLLASESAEPTWQIEGINGQSSTQLATGGPGLASVNSEPVTTPPPGSASPSFQFPTYPFTGVCSTPCYSSVYPTWTFLKPGVFQPGAKSHTTLNVRADLTYTAFPWYPITQDQLRLGLALAYGVDVVQIGVQDGWIQTPPTEQYNQTDLTASFTVWSYVQMPALEPQVSGVVQAAQQQAVKMSNIYVTEETNRISRLCEEYSANDVQMSSFFAQVMPASTWTGTQKTSDVTVTATVQGAPANIPYPPTTVGSQSVKITVPSAFPPTITPVFEVVSSAQIVLASQAARDIMTGSAGQIALQKAVAGFLRVAITAVTLEGISFDSTMHSRLRRLTSATPVPMNVKYTAQASSMNQVRQFRQIILSGAYGVPGLGGRHLWSNISSEASTVGLLPGNITSAVPIQGSTYSRLIIPGEVIATPPPTASATNPPGSSIVISPAAAGATTLQVADQTPFAVGDEIFISSNGMSETNWIVAFGSLVLASPLQHSYPANAVVTKVVHGTTTEAASDNSSSTSSSWPWWAWVLLVLLLALAALAAVWLWMSRGKQRKKKDKLSSRQIHGSLTESELAPLREAEAPPATRDVVPALEPAPVYEVRREETPPPQDLSKGGLTKPDLLASLPTQSIQYQPLPQPQAPQLYQPQLVVSQPDAGTFMTTGTQALTQPRPQPPVSYQLSPTAVPVAAPPVAAVLSRPPVMQPPPYSTQTASSMYYR